MANLATRSVLSTESRRSLKRNWKGIAKLTSRPAKKVTSSWLTLSFSDEDYLLGEPNESIPFVISAHILGLDVKRVLVDQNNSIDTMFQDLLPKLGVSVSDLRPYHGGEIGGHGPDPVRPIGYLEALVTYGQKELIRAVNTTFLVVPLITPYHCIIGRPTLAKLGVVASAVHLKMKFHFVEGEPITVSADVNAAERSQYLPLRGTRLHLKEIPEPPRTSGQVLLTEVDTRYDPDSSNEEDENNLSRELKKKNKRPEPQREFVEVPLRDDPSKTVKLGADLLKAIREELVQCLRQNADLFAWSASEMPGSPSR